MHVAELEILNTGSPLSPLEFSQFMVTLKTLITALSNIDILPKTNTNWEPSPQELCEIKYKLQSININLLDDYINKNEDSAPLLFQSITFNSPIKIACICWGTLFTLAIVFGGGKVEFSADPKGKIQFKGTLTSLGEAIQKFNEALSLNKNISIGSGIQNTKIVLNEQEYDLLMKQKAETKKDGGFQGFLVSLQYRIDHKNKELELNKSDIEKIYRYKKNPSKGGFQLRCEKIFGRHFPDRS